VLDQRIETIVKINAVQNSCLREAHQFADSLEFMASGFSETRCFPAAITSLLI
jgi:hypothetical protein